MGPHIDGTGVKAFSPITPEKIKKEKKKMIWTIIGILLVLWLLGFVADVAGGLIHLLLVVAAVVLVVKLILGRRAV